MPVIKTEDYLSPSEAAKKLGMPVSTIHRYCYNYTREVKNGTKLACTPVGRTILIHKDEVRRFKKENRGRGRPRNLAS